MGVTRTGTILNRSPHIIFIHKPKIMKIKTCEQMYDLANKGGSVYVKNWGRSTSAAFFISWQVRLLIIWIKQDQFTINKTNHDN